MPHLSGRPPSDEQFTELVHASWSSLYRTAYLLLGDHAEAEDLVQSALAKTGRCSRTALKVQDRLTLVANAMFVS